MMAQGHGTTSAPRQMLPPQETGGKDERTGGRSKTPTSNQQPEDGTKAGIHKRMQPCKGKDYGTRGGARGGPGAYDGRTTGRTAQYARMRKRAR